MKNGLIVFAKKPEMGKVKTRLVPPLTYEEAKELYSCFLKDAIIQYVRLAARLNFRIFLAVSPDQAIGYFQDFVNNIQEIKKSRPEITLKAQTGSDLGEKMFNAFADVFASDYANVVIIGTDHPTLPDAYIARAFEELAQEKTDGVIGPAEDGGYYLLGLKKVKREYFEGVPWSTGRVFDQTINNLNMAEKTVCTLPEWYDVDNKDSLFKMVHELMRSDCMNEPVYSKQFLSHINVIEV